MALTQVTSEGIKDGEVKNADMADDAVGVAELSATGTASSSTFLRGDNSWATPTDTNTQLSTEEVQDIVGGMFTGNTETNITATYQDADGTIDLVSTDTNTQLAFANDANNRVVTGDGSGGLNGEANLTFDGSKLTVQGDNGLVVQTETAPSSDTDPSGEIFFNNSSNNNVNAKIVTFRNSGTSGGDLAFFTRTHGDGTNTEGLERLRIDSSGRVGIGQTSFATSDTMLSVSETSGHCEVGIISKNDSGALINFGDTDSYNQGRIKYDNSAGQLEFKAAGTDCVRMQADNMTIVDGDLIIGTAGHGIDFSAQTATSASGSTTTSEVLDHYEEGSWTPAFAANQGQTPTHTTQVGQYTRIGNWVTVQFYCAWSACTSMGTQARIGGLPFTSSYYGSGSCFLNNWNFNNDQVRDVVLHHSGHYEIYLYYTRDDGGWEPLPCDDNAAIIGTMSYKVA
tara:strand:- start:265 stop:1626 length:1362 start_codon:yes stop_codon:yes gene_type:complete